MKQPLVNSLALLITTAFFAVMGLVVFCFATLKDDHVYAGEAYGFVIGESRPRVYERATELKAQGKIEEIRRILEGRGAIQFGDTDLASTGQDKTWSMNVDSDWWNNTIRLEFSNGRLAEIHRFRICCELP